MWFQVIPVTERKWSFLHLKFITSSHHIRLLRKGGFHTSYLSDWIWKPEKCSLQAWNVGNSKDKPGCVGRHTFLLPPFGTQLWSNRELKLLQSLKLLSQNSWGSPDQPRRWHFPCSEKREFGWLQQGAGHVTQAARSRDPRCICCRNNIKSIVYAAFIVKNLHNSSKTMLSILFPVFSLIGLAPSCTLLSHSSTSSYCLYPCKNKENGMFFFCHWKQYGLTCSRTCQTSVDHRGTTWSDSSIYCFAPGGKKLLGEELFMK